MSTHNIRFLNVKKKIIQNLQLWDLFQGTQERVRNSRGKRASVFEPLNCISALIFVVIIPPSLHNHTKYVKGYIVFALAFVCSFVFPSRPWTQDQKLMRLSL